MYDVTPLLYLPHFTLYIKWKDWGRKVRTDMNRKESEFAVRGG